ncbi:MAG: T9SS type A sorting domain-containing protein [Chitinophagales bacterium]
MKRANFIRYFVLLCVLFLQTYGAENLLKGQSLTDIECGTDLLHQTKLETDPNYRFIDEQYEEAYQDYVGRGDTANTTVQRIAPYTIPTVVHIVSPSGPDLLTPEQVEDGINHINTLFSGSDCNGLVDFVDIQIELSLAKRTIDNGESTGITSHNDDNLTDHDINNEQTTLKTLGPIDDAGNLLYPSTDYLNIWIVDRIFNTAEPNDGEGIAGYSTLAASHGTALDGFVVEAAFWTDCEAAKTAAHELGHYFNLYHTFGNNCDNNNYCGCLNNDCKIDGDKVCDTPPDSSNDPSDGCSGPINTCDTDVMDGFTDDVNDLRDNFMDYGDQTCHTSFTFGQRNRMWFTLQAWNPTMPNGIRSSLVYSEGNLEPCDDYIEVDFTVSPSINNGSIDLGTTLTFTSSFIPMFPNSKYDVFEWTISQSDALIASQNSDVATVSYQFNEEGIFTVALTVSGDDMNCTPQLYSMDIEVVCPIYPVITVEDDITEIIPGDVLTFSSSIMPNATTTLSWFVEEGFELETNQSFMYDDFNVAGYTTIYLEVTTMVNGISCSKIASKRISVGNCNRLKQANIWYFGKNAGLDFNTEEPTILLDGQLNSSESCASIANESGDLLFYTDGVTVWNRQHTPMFNGEGLKGNRSSAQGALIAPMPGETNQGIYYVFTSGATENAGAANGNGERGLWYSIVDMNGTTDGEVTVKNAIIDNSNDIKEGVTAALHCNGTDVWIICAKKIDDAPVNSVYQTYLLDSNGIVGEIIGSNMPIEPYSVSTELTSIGIPFKFSPSGDKLAFNGKISSTDNVQTLLWNFDNEDGSFNTLTNISNDYSRGIEFSPNGSKIYLKQGNIDGVLIQYDLTDPDIVSSAEVIANSISNFHLQLAVNGKIYGKSNGSDTPYLSVINNPDLSASDCNFESNSLYLDDVQYALTLLPNIFYNGLAYNNRLTISGEEIVCTNTEVTYIDACSDTKSYQWSIEGGNNPEPYTILNDNTMSNEITFNFQEAGDYTLSCIKTSSCGTTYEDQMDITVAEGITFDWIDGDSHICEGETAFFTFSTNATSGYYQNVEEGSNPIVLETPLSSFDISDLSGLDNCFELVLSDIHGCTHTEKFCVDAACIDVTSNISNNAPCVGEEVTVTYTICNENDATITGLNFGELGLPAGIIVIDDSELDITKVEIDETECITVSATLLVTNEATADVTQNINLEIGYTINSTINSAYTTAVIDVTPLYAGLQVNKAVSQTSAAGGDQLTYTITLTNHTGAVITDILLEDVFPPTGLSPLAQNMGLPNPTWVAPVLTSTIPSIGAGTSVSYQYMAQVGGNASCGELENCVTVSTDMLGNSTCQTATDCVTVSVGGNVAYASFCYNTPNTLPDVNDASCTDASNDYIFPENTVKTWNLDFVNGMGIDGNPFLAGTSANPIRINGDIVVTKGTTLTIIGLDNNGFLNGPIHFSFGPQGRIVVLQGGTLIIDNAVMNGATDCNTMWQGIRIYNENYLTDTNPQNSLTINASNINDALIGVATCYLPKYDFDNMAEVLEADETDFLLWGNSFVPKLFPEIWTGFETGGGDLIVEDTDFFNCFMGVDFSHQEGLITDIIGCNFSCLPVSNSNGTSPGVPFPLNAVANWNPSDFLPEVIGETGISAVFPKITKTANINDCDFENMRFGVRLQNVGFRVQNSRFYTCIIGSSLSSPGGIPPGNIYDASNNLYCCNQISIQASAIPIRIAGNRFQRYCEEVSSSTTINNGACLFANNVENIGVLLQACNGFLIDYGNEWQTPTITTAGTAGITYGLALQDNNGGKIQGSSFKGNRNAIYVLGNNKYVGTCDNFFQDYYNDAIHIGISTTQAANVGYVPAINAEHMLGVQGDCEFGNSTQLPAINQFILTNPNNPALSIYAEPNPAGSLTWTYQNFRYFDTQSTISGMTNTTNFIDEDIYLQECQDVNTNTANYCDALRTFEQIIAFEEEEEKDRAIVGWIQKFMYDIDATNSDLDSLNILLDAVNTTYAQRWSIKINLAQENLAKVAEKLANFELLNDDDVGFYYIYQTLYNMALANKDLSDINTAQTASLLAIASQKTNASFHAKTLLYAAKGYEFAIDIPLLSENSSATCDIPTELWVTDLSCSAVTLHWTTMPNAEAYQLAGRKQGGIAKVFPETQNTFRAFDNGLQTNTTYEWSVRTKCNGSWSDWHTPIATFITPICKNSNYDSTQDPFVNETDDFFHEINLYPNPTKNELHINFTSFATENMQLNVTDILGKTVLKQDIETKQGENKFTLEVEHLKTGTYFLIIKNEAQQNVEKFTIW